jgi:hypothetical protein
MYIENVTITISFQIQISPVYYRDVLPVSKGTTVSSRPLWPIPTTEEKAEQVEEHSSQLTSQNVRIGTTQI